MKKTIIQIICCLMVVTLAFGISWLIGKGIPPNADAGPPTQIEHTHSFGDWQTTKEATCTEAGTEMRTCECGQVELKELEALGHEEERTIQSEPSCSQEGQANISCSRCGELLRTEAIPKTNHTIANKTITSATCTQEGTVERYCTVCKQLFGTLQTSALGHKYVNGECSRCGKIDSSVYAFTVSMKSKLGEYVVQTPANQTTYAKLIWESNPNISIKTIDTVYFVATFSRSGKSLTIGDTNKLNSLYMPLYYTVGSTEMDLSSKYDSFFVNGKYTVQFKIIINGKTYISTKFEFDYNKNYAYWFTVSAT